MFYTAFGPSGPSGLMMPKNRLDFHHESNASSLLILPPFWQSLGNRNPLLYFTALDTSLSQGMSASQFHCVGNVLRIEDRQHSLFNLRTLGIFDIFAFGSPISINLDSTLPIPLFLALSPAKVFRPHNFIASIKYFELRTDNTRCSIYGR